MLHRRDLATSTVEVCGFSLICWGVWYGLGAAAGLIVTGGFLTLVGWLVGRR